MPIEIEPHPETPRRPKLTAEALASLYASDIHGPSRVPARQWLTDMRDWVKWSDDYRKRLAAWYVEHQAVNHDRKVDPADLGHDPLYYRTKEECKICAYLLEQYNTHSL